MKSQIDSDAEGQELGAAAGAPAGSVADRQPRQARQPGAKRLRAPKRGWYIRERGDRFLAHARDPRTNKYRCETFKNEAEARDWAEKQRARFVLEQDTITQGNTLLRGITDELKRDHVLHNASQGHVDQIERVVARVIAAGITRIDQPDIVSRTRQFLTDLQTRGRRPASDATKNSHLKVLRTIATWAIDQEIVKTERNPFDKIGYIPTVVKMKEVFTLAEVRELVSLKHRDHGFYRPFCSMIYTGFRIGEMAHMDWSWFRWDQNRLHLKIAIKARARRNTPPGWRPKNLRERTTRLMDEHAEVMLKFKQDSGLVFPHLKPLSNKQRQDRFNEYLNHCGVEVLRRTPHSCRHTWTCLMLASGEAEFKVQQYAGHSDEEMTEHYGKQFDLYSDEVEAEGWKGGRLSLRAAPKPVGPKAQPEPIQMPRRAQ